MSTEQAVQVDGDKLMQFVFRAVDEVAGEARIRGVVTAAGFTRFRRITETPLNVVYEARP